MNLLGIPGTKAKRPATPGGTAATDASPDAADLAACEDEVVVRSRRDRKRVKAARASVGR